MSMEPRPKHLLSEKLSLISMDDNISNQDEKESMHHIPVHVLNPHLICGLCQGYLYEACTITECMHSFCKSCLVKHLLRSLNCPMCAILIHPTDPFVHIRLDGMLQDIVYALLPQVEKVELERERLFYEKHGVSDKCKKKNKRGYQRDEPKRELRRSSIQKSSTSQQSPNVPCVHKHSLYPSLMFTPPVALNLQCLETSGKFHKLEKPFVHVMGGTTVHILAVFLRKKLQITDSHQVDLYCPHTSGLVSLDSDDTLKTIKDLYYQDVDIMKLSYDVKEP